MRIMYKNKFSRSFCFGLDLRGTLTRCTLAITWKHCKFFIKSDAKLTVNLFCVYARSLHSSFQLPKYSRVNCKRIYFLQFSKTAFVNFSIELLFKTWFCTRSTLIWIEIANSAYFIWNILFSISLFPRCSTIIGQ